MDLTQLFEEARQGEEKLAWEGTFGEYLQLATQNRALSRLSHARVYDMIMAAGVEAAPWGQPRYRLFDQDLFGLERSLRQVVEYFGSAARRLEVRKRILLLMGPPASGKSTLTTVLKRGLERYTRSDEGALYAIVGCPMQEEPLHLVPQELRPRLWQEYGLYIEGDLCPRCRYALRSTYGGRILEVRVRRIALSEKEGIGIGTYVATDPGSQEIARLVGSIDEAALEQDRVQSAGKAYRLDGELNVANRGIMEFIDMLKLEERFLSVLTVLAQEQNIKIGRSGMVYADEAIIAHSNEADYQACLRSKTAEALKDRLIVIRVPYNLRVRGEVRIYEKMLRESNLEGIHLSPLTLETAATFAVLSRLEPSRKAGMTLWEKLRLYNGEYAAGFTQRDVEEMQEQSPREGMIGVSPRFVMNRLANVIAKAGTGCVAPPQLLIELWDGLEQSPQLSQEERERLFALFKETRAEYDRVAQKELQKAFVADLAGKANDLFGDYVRNLELLLGPGGTATQGGGEEGARPQPDERMMRLLEDAVGVREVARQNFRREVWQQVTALAHQGLPSDYTTDPTLREAIEKRLLPDWREVAGALRSAEPGYRREEALARLVEEQGYCSECAAELWDYLAQSQRVGERPGGRRLRWLWR